MEIFLRWAGVTVFTLLSWRYLWNGRDEFSVKEWGMTLLKMVGLLAGYRSAARRHDRRATLHVTVSHTDEQNIDSRPAYDLSADPAVSSSPQHGGELPQIILIPIRIRLRSGVVYQMATDLECCADALRYLVWHPSMITNREVIYV